MKITKLLFVLTFSLLFNTNSKAQDVEKKYPIMTFEQKEFDLGTLNEGDVVERTYKFTNTGDAPLIISKIRASCGCTVPSGWKKTPIMPGEKSEFKVKFNTKHKIKKQHKTITITCNTKSGREIVRFHAFVIPDPKMEKERAERRKRWAEQRKAREAAKKANREKKLHNKTIKKNHKLEKKQSIFEKKYTEKELAVQQKIYAQRTKVKKLELKILKKESKLLLKKEKWSKEKVKAKKAEIQKLRKKIAEHNKKVYELRHQK
jgi:hypothetical protein